MQQEKVTTRAHWKVIYAQIFQETPKHQRRTKKQIKHIRARAKHRFYISDTVQGFLS